MSTSISHPILREDERLRAPKPVPRVILSREGERMMRAELERLRERLEGEFTARLREAREFGDSRENDEYLQIKEEEAVVASRIRQLESLLAAAEIAADDPEGGGVVGIGSLVKVRDLDKGALRRHRIIGGFEQAEPGDVSASSPVGEALMGRSPGEEVAVELPNGRTVRLEIVSVD